MQELILLKRIRDDLLLRAEIDSEGCKVVDLSSSVWIALNDAIAIADDKGVKV